MNQDILRKQKKRRRVWFSFVVVLFLLLAVFFAAINTGSLSVSFGQLLRGLFVSYDENVAAVYDLRFPRILISMLAGAAIAVSGVLFQAVLKNPLADPGIIGISSGAGFAAVCISTFFPTLYFFTPFAAFFGGVAAFFSGLLSFVETRFKPVAYYPHRSGGGCAVYRTFQRIQHDDRWTAYRGGIDCRSQYHTENLVRCEYAFSICGSRAVSCRSVYRRM